MRTFVLAFTSCLAAAGAVPAFSFPQPLPLASWTNTSAGPTPCTTEPAYAIRSFATGWPGQCTGLSPYAPLTLPVVPMTMAECRKACVAEVRCTVWQFIQTTDGTGTCFMDGILGALGDHCMDRDGGTLENVTGAERIQRGSVKVLSNLTNFNGNNESLWVWGLHAVGVATSGDAANNTLRCRDYCYSNIDCTYWQFNEQCYVETGGSKAQFPLQLTTETAGTEGAISSNTNGIDPAHTMKAGEYIQHTCVTQAEVDAAAAAKVAAANAAAAAAAGSGYTWLYVLLGVLALVALAALAYCVTMGGGKKKPRAVKKTRAVKAPKVEAAEPESVPLMPLSMPSPYAQASPFGAPPMQFPGYNPSQFQQQY